MSDIGVFKCNGDIFKLIYGDQIHDFMGERLLSNDRRTTRTEKDMINNINKAWKFYGLDLNKEKQGFKVESYQTLSERIISKYSGESKSGKELGDINKFKNLNVNNKELMMRYEEDLGLSTRLYIQQVCKNRHKIDIQKDDYTADIHVDATKGKAHYFLTSMVNLPVTFRAVQDAYLCKEEDKELQNYFKQIKFTPLLANIFDMASFNQLYKTSAAYYNEEIKIKNEVATFLINDTNGNTMKWQLRNVPKFYNIAYWFVRDTKMRDFYNIKEVDDFITSLDLNKDNKDDIYFLYSLMIDGFKNFINKKIELSNKKTKTLKSVLKNAIKTIKIGPKEAYTFLTQKIRLNLIKKETYELTSKFILKIIDDILLVSKSNKNKLKFYDIGCREVYVDETYLRNIMFYSYITMLQLETDKTSLDLKPYLYSTQKYLQGFDKDPGASVKNIQRSMVYNKNKDPNYMLTLLMLKSLGDLTIITNSFYDGIITNENINFFATFDRTAASIATTLSYNDTSLYPYVLLEQPGYGTGAYYPENLSKEFNVKDILRLGNLEVIKKDKLEEYENSKSNCELFKDKYLDNIEDLKIKETLESLNCANSYNENWDILEESTSNENATLLSSLYSYFFN